MKTLEDVYRQGLPDPAAWLSRLGLQMTIAGVDAPARRTVPVFNACRGVVVAECPEAEIEHLDRAVAAASAAFAAWAATGWAERRGMLDGFADLLQVQCVTLAKLIACETGRPLRRCWSEVAFAAEYVRIIASQILPETRLPRPGQQVTMRYRPLGVAGAIVPWNGPVVLGVAKIVNALLAGDTLVLRPSPFTPLSALYMGMLGREVFPPGVFNVITGDAAVGVAMVAHPKIAKISFTGSTATGKRIAAAAAPTLKRLTLELGGNDAAIILADADVEAVATSLFNISFANAGHFCAAIKRLYVHDAAYDGLCAALAARFETAVLGDSFDPAVTMAPVQNRAQFERIWELFDDAVAQGGRVLAGGQRSKLPGLFIPPTLVEGIGHGVRLVDEEQFGPVLPLIRFQDEAQALAMANDSQYGLGGSVWSRDVPHAVALAEKLEVGTAWVNQHGAFTAALPMPFAKESGIGIDYAEFGVAGHAQAFLVNAALPG